MDTLKVNSYLRSALPEKVEEAKTDPRAAIRLECLECQRGKPESVESCVELACFLWPFRLGPKGDL